MALVILTLAVGFAQSREMACETYFYLSIVACTGDGVDVVVNGNIYDEGNPTGMEVLTNAAGCDSCYHRSSLFLMLPPKK